MPNEATQSTTNGAVGKSAVQRLVICFRWSWRWGSFWKMWGKEAKGVPLLLWMALVGLVAGVIQVFMVMLFPLRWLLLDPIKTGLICTSKHAENLEKVLGR